MRASTDRLRQARPHLSRFRLPSPPTPRRIPLGLGVAAALVLGAALAGCSNGDRDGASAASPVSSSGADEPSGELTVYAAASLQGAMTELLDAFVTEHPEVDPVLVADGSSTLAAQLVEGAPADVFASADERTMQIAVDGGAIDGDAVAFASNELRLVTPAGNPAGIESIADLANPEVAVVLCAPAVPCGAAAATLLAASGVEVSAASEEQNVTAVLTKVVTGEADAGLVYATDAQSAGSDIEVFTPIGAESVVNLDEIALVRGASTTSGAESFIEFVLGDAGQEILASYGFLGPADPAPPAEGDSE